MIGHPICWVCWVSFPVMWWMRKVFQTHPRVVLLLQRIATTYIDSLNKIGTLRLQAFNHQKVWVKMDTLCSSDFRGEHWTLNPWNHHPQLISNIFQWCVPEQWCFFCVHPKVAKSGLKLYFGTLKFKQVRNSPQVLSYILPPSHHPTPIQFLSFRLPPNCLSSRF